MKLPIIGQIVGYVTPAMKYEPSKIVDAKVIDVFPADGEVHLDYSEGTPGAENYKERRAIAAFNSDKATENTWHEKQPDAAPVSAAPKRVATQQE